MRHAKKCPARALNTGMKAIFYRTLGVLSFLGSLTLEEYVLLTCWLLSYLSCGLWYVELK